MMKVIHNDSGNGNEMMKTWDFSFGRKDSV